MFAQFFGGYLFNHKLCTAEDLTQAFEAKKHTRLRLGVLAIKRWSYDSRAGGARQYHSAECR